MLTVHFYEKLHDFPVRKKKKKSFCKINLFYSISMYLFCYRFDEWVGQIQYTLSELVIAV